MAMRQIPHVYEATAVMKTRVSSDFSILSPRLEKRQMVTEMHDESDYSAELIVGRSLCNHPKNFSEGIKPILVFKIWTGS